MKMRKYFALRKSMRRVVVLGVCLLFILPIFYQQLDPYTVVSNDDIIYVENSTGFFDNVENGTNGWTTSGVPASNNTFGWHIVSWNSLSPTHAWWCGNDISNLTGNNWNLSLISPLFDLTTAYYVNFSFWHRYRIDSYFDYGYVEININGTSSWTPVFSFTGYQTSWIKNQSDISVYAGKYIYIRFRFESDPVSIDSGWYIDDIELEVQGNFNAPTLTDTNVTPPIGNTSTLFTYWVNYTDADNNPPTSINVIIDEVPYSMNKYDLADFNFTNGCLYNYSIYLSNATHSYYFTASDGNYSTRNPVVSNYTGPTVNLINVQPLTLENGFVTPFDGRNSEIFSFNVTYLDPENQPPSYINVIINGTSFAMNPLDPADMTYADGAVYSYTTSLAMDGVYAYYFNASDGLYQTGYPSAGALAGPYTWLYSMMGGTPYSGSLDNETDPSDSYKRYYTTNEEEKWLCVALRPESDIHVDLELYWNFSTFLLASPASDNRTNLLIYNSSSDSYNKYYIRAYIQEGSGSYRIETGSNPTLPAVLDVADEYFTGSFNPNEILDVWKFGGHEAGRTYNLTVNMAPSMDIDVYIFNSTGTRDDAIANSRTIGAGVMETTLFQLSTTDNFTIVFVSENGIGGSYSYNITTDYSAPITKIDSPLNRSYNTPLLDVNLSCLAPDLDTMWYRVRNATGWIIVNTTWNVGAQLNLNDGTYTLYAWANDTEGNIQNPPSQVTFTVDTVPPTAAIDSPLASVYSTNEVFINLSSTDTDVASYWYRSFNRTGMQWIDSSNITWTGNLLRAFPEGNYSLFAWANDTAGNIQTATVSVNFIINTPPQVKILTPENQTYTTNNITIELTTTATDIHSIWYRIANKTGWVIGNTTWYMGIYENLADGSYTLYAWGNDSLGLISHPQNITFTIDTTAPAVSIITPLNTTYHLSNILINISSTAPDLDSIWYQLYDILGESWVDSTGVLWSSPLLCILPDGLYSIFVWANDTLGNVLSVPKNINFTVDSPPEIISISIINETTYTSSPILNITINAPDLDTIWYSIFDGSTWIIENTTWTEAVTLELGNGNYTLYIWASDTQGNMVLNIISFRIKLPSSDGPNSIIWIIVIIVGTVSAVAIFYRYKKSKAIKRKTKTQPSKAAQTFAERVKPQQ